MGINAVSDTGPLYHLSQIKTMEVFVLFSPLAIPPEVEKELAKYKVPVPSFVKTIQLEPKTKDFINLLAFQFELDLGEAEAIALVRQENAHLFFTDDLDARQTAKDLGIVVHGSVGILLRAFREGRLSKKEATEKIRALQTTTLYITSELIEQAVRSMEEYRKS